MWNNMFFNEIKSIEDIGYDIEIEKLKESSIFLEGVKWNNKERPSKTGKYLAFSIGEAKIKFKGKSMTIPIEVDNRVGKMINSVVNQINKDLKKYQFIQQIISKAINNEIDIALEDIEFEGGIPLYIKIIDANVAEGIYLYYKVDKTIKSKTIRVENNNRDLYMLSFSAMSMASAANSRPL